MGQWVKTGQVEISGVCREVPGGGGGVCDLRIEISEL